MKEKDGEIEGDDDVCVCVCVCVSYSKLVSVTEIVCGWVCERENERKIIEMVFMGIYVR